MWLQILRLSTDNDNMTQGLSKNLDSEFFRVSGETNPKDDVREKERER